MKRIHNALVSVLLTLFISSVSAAQTQDPWDYATEIVASIQTPNIPDKTFNVLDFGAKAKNINPAVTAAIAAASKQGGGKVVIPAGTWLSKGPIHLKSKINLHLSAGATLLFSGEPQDYLPVVKTRWEGTEVLTYSPLIYAADVEDVAITGKGIVDGNKNSQFIAWYKKAHPSMMKLREMGANATPVEERVFGEGEYLRPPLVQFFNAKRVLLEDYSSINSPFWVTHLVYAQDVTIRGIRIDSHIGNNDGVDVESSRNVLIENSWFRTGDDSVVIKSGRDLDGRVVGVPSENIVVRHNDMGGEDGIALGSEMSGGIKNVYFHDNVLRKGDSAFRFKSNLDRGGVVENIYIKNFEVESFYNLFWFQLNYPRQGEDIFPPTYKNIVFENIKVKDAKNVLDIHAPVEQPLLNVTFKNVRVNSYQTLFNVENATGVSFENFVAGKQKIDGSLTWQQTK